MNTRYAPIFTAAAFAASCINYTGLEGDGSDYTKPQALGAAGGSAETPDAGSPTDAGRVDAAGGSAETPDAGSPTDAGRVDAGRCQADGLTTCSVETCDDGTSAAASLGAASLDCQYRSSGSNWATAMGYCAGLGSGWRLPSKGEALKIASSSNVCRTPLSGPWNTWTRTCAGAGLAWYVYSGNGFAGQGNVYDFDGYAALCVR